MLGNSTIAGGQQQSAVAALADGRYFLTWIDGSGQGGDVSNYGIKAQLFDSAGVKSGAEFLVNSQTLNSQNNPAVAGLASGGAVVTWVDNSATGADTSGSGIKARLLDANGTATGAEFLVNQTTLNAQKMPTVAALASGGFVIAWADTSLQGGDASVSSIKAQVFGQSGAQIGTEFLVNTNTANGQDTPMVAALAGGGFVVSWHDSSLIGGDTSKDAIKAQLYTAAGTKIGTEFLVNTETASNQQQQTVASLASGGFVIAWADASARGGDASNYGIKMQVYDAAGVRVGGETLVNTSLPGAQIAPSVATLSGGRFLVSWTDYGGTGPEAGTPGIKGQIFADHGAKIGGEFIVNSLTPAARSIPRVPVPPEAGSPSPGPISAARVATIPAPR